MAQQTTDKRQQNHGHWTYRMNWPKEQFIEKFNLYKYIFFLLCEARLKVICEIALCWNTLSTRDWAGWGEHRTGYTLHFTVYVNTIHGILYTEHCILYSIHFTVYTINFTV